MKLAPLAAFCGSLVLLLSTQACGSASSATATKPVTYPKTFHGARRVMQVVGAKGETSMTLRFTPHGERGAAFAYCTGAPKGTKVLLAATGRQWRQEGDFAIPCAGRAPKKLTAGWRNVLWGVTPRNVGKPLVLRAALVKTRVNDNTEEVIATPVKHAPGVRIVAAAYAPRH